MALPLTSTITPRSHGVPATCEHPTPYFSGADGGLFARDGFYPSTDEEAAAAKAVCAECAVREMCLEHALGSRERDGVWGGATEKERRRIIRQRRRTA